MHNIERFIQHGSLVDQLAAISGLLAVLLIFLGVFVNEDFRKFGYASALLAVVLFLTTYVGPYIESLTNIGKH